MLAAAACSGGGSGGADEEPAPAPGGTLRLAGAGDVDHLDPALAFYTPSYKLLRALTRQLVAYPNDATPAAEATPVPDLATAIPEPTNGGRTYTFTLRDGAQWNAPTGPRQITAEDVARGFKRLCNPAEPTSARDYYQGVIAGMADYCASFGGVPPEVDAMKEFVEETDIPGIKVVDDRTVEFTLERPANDFINILALPSSSPAPVEVLDYLPDSPEFRKNFVASGPYAVETYVSDKRINLTRNPAWRPETDAIRAAYVDRIEIRLGLNEQQVQNALESGAADMQWDTEVPAIDLPRLQDARDPRLTINPNGSTSPYLVINLRSPNGDKALSETAVRRAINYAIDKRAIVEVLGGPSLQQPIGQILPPTVSGHEPIDPYATLSSAGDPARAKDLLAQAGHRDRLALTMPHRSDGKHPAVAQILRQSLAEAGIDLELVPTDDLTLYKDYLQNPEAAAQGKWDIALVGWAPAWPGNAARSIFAPLLDGRDCGPGSTNYGCYNNPQVNALIDQAVTAPTAEAASALWHRADQQVMADAAWAPLVTGNTVNFRSDRVAGWVYLPYLQDGDITNVWLVP